jgi:glycosyltransferase involved in cell wall biosynthesis
VSSGPRVAVIIPCFNDGATVGDAVRSVLDQDEQCELIVVDDGSDDDSTATVLTELTRAGVRVVRQENRGLSAARTTGLRETAAALVFPLDADDVLVPGALRRLADVLDRRPDLVAVWGDHETFGASHLVQRRARTLDPWAITFVNQMSYAALIRRAALEAVGGWHMRGGYEDWDVWMALAERGWCGEHIGEVTHRYRVSPGGRMLARAQEGHSALYAELRTRHPALFAARTTARRGSRAPLRLRLLLPLIDRLPLAAADKNRLNLVVANPVSAVVVRLQRALRGLRVRSGA